MFVDCISLNPKSSGLFLFLSNSVSIWYLSVEKFRFLIESFSFFAFSSGKYCFLILVLSPCQCPLEFSLLYNFLGDKNKISSVRDVHMPQWQLLLQHSLKSYQTNKQTKKKKKNSKTGKTTEESGFEFLKKDKLTRDSDWAAKLSLNFLSLFFFNQPYHRICLFSHVIN